MRKGGPARYLAKNGTSETSRGQAMSCQIVTQPSADPHGQPNYILTCDCQLPPDPSSTNRMLMQEAMEKRRLQQQEKSAEEKSLEIAQAKSQIVRLLQEGLAKRLSKAGNRQISWRSTAPNPASPNRLPKWVQVVNGLMIYQFNVFNCDPNDVDHDKLASIIGAIQKDLDSNFSYDYGMSGNFEIYTLDDLKRPELFQGDRIAIFIGPYGNGAFHYANATEPANTYSFPLGGGALGNDGLTLPAGSNYDFIPYSIINSTQLNLFMGSPANIYAISPTTLPSQAIQDAKHQVLSCALSHEIKEILGNDAVTSWIMFDQYAPTVANWHWVEFKDHLNPLRCTNSSPGTGANSGYVEAPLFLKQFKSGGIFFVVKEFGDPVSSGSGSLLNGHFIDGWVMQNYPLQNFWKPYNADPSIKYDFLGNVRNPLEPYGGLHELIFFISYDDGNAHLLKAVNYGPITADMIGAPSDNNFPPDYVIVSQLSVITAGTSVISLLNDIKGLGNDVSNPRDYFPLGL